MGISVREKILDVANKVIAEKGLNYFTLDEIAKEAGVSKGGLLYHFPSKDKLISGLIEKYINQFNERISEGTENFSKETDYNWLISFIHEQFNQTFENSNAMSGLLAAVALNQSLLLPVVEKRKEWYQKCYEAKDPIMCIIISFVCDGISFANLLGLEVFPQEIKAQLMERLINLAKESY